MKKRCFKCGALKSLDDFYRHPAMADGRLGKCKECTKKDNKANRAAKPEQYREYERARQQTTSRREKQAEYAIRLLERHPDANRERTRRYVEKYPEKRAAHIAVGNALRDRHLMRQPCEVCGDANAEAHHDDYSKPLDVRWLCKLHHMDHHWRQDQQIRAA